MAERTVDVTRPPLRSRVPALWYGIIAVGLVLVGWWAGSTALAPPTGPLDASSPITYRVTRGEVGRSLSFSAVAEWQGRLIGHQAASGVVTTVDLVPGEMVEAGRLLYTVALRPVVAAAGEIPSFRDLSNGSEGRDVRQIQELLVALGFLNAEPDGVFGASTRRAVQEWQRSIGIRADGVVRAGDIVFLPSLPTRLSVAEGIVPGSRLAGGEQILLQLPDEPTFRVPLLVEQRDLVPLSATVFVMHEEGRWEGIIERAVETPEGGLDLILRRSDGMPICWTDCEGSVPFDGRTAFSAEIVVVPPVEGLVVPVAALVTDAGGQALVTLRNGERVPVEIVASAGGLSVVQGVSEGQEILLPVEPGQAGG
jgi:peptidoglycan hydrolase-like protein with peptidoglycan-binding domain